jgi:RNA polymerase sigma factor (sigma-70 family)
MQNATDQAAVFQNPLAGPLPAAATRPVIRVLLPDPEAPTASWTDQLLVEACLRGDQRAWAVLIGRYKNLIYSFPRRYGANAADAADVFQLVCAELFRSLPRLRHHACLRAWLMTVASHQSFQWKRSHIRRATIEGEDPEMAADTVGTEPSDELERVEQQRVIRDAVNQLPPRCRDLVQMLFYMDPPAPYQRVAGHLGLAIGSIGLIRSRCLKKLERLLEGTGVATECD